LAIFFSSQKWSCTSKSFNYPGYITNNGNVFAKRNLIEICKFLNKNFRSGCTWQLLFQKQIVKFAHLLMVLKLLHISSKIGTSRDPGISNLFDILCRYLRQS